jgi:hypothetical protein
MDNKINLLEYKITNIENNILKILNILETNIAPNCSRMDSHISFIETIYSNVRTPMDYICNSINKLYIKK